MNSVYNSTNLNESKKEVSAVINICFKDDPDLFKIALESIINQTYKPKEIIIVEDGPITANQKSIINKMDYKGINCKTVVLPNNCGRGISRAEGIKAVTCEYVAIMDSDDISLPDRFEKQINYFMNNSDVDVCGGIICEYENNPNVIVSSRIMPESDKKIKKMLKKRNPINHVTSMMKKSTVIKGGNYMPGFIDEDYYLMCRLYLVGAKFHNLNEKLVKVNIGNGMINRRGGMHLFRSQLRFNKWMLQQKIINIFRFFFNISERFLVLVLMPAFIRKWFYITFLRKNFIVRKDNHFSQE